MATDLYKGMDQQYDVARKRAAKQEGANLQAQRDALARRAAQLGGGPSGAFIKTEQLAANDSAERLGQANEGIDAAQQAERRRIDEVVQGQEFAKGEREGSQNFSAAQAALGRAYGTSERLGSQDFGAGQAALQRAYGTQERIAGQDYGTQERLGTQEFGAGQAELQRRYGTSERVAGQEYGTGAREA